MKSHYLHPTGFALGLTSGVLYTICALAFKLWPIQTLRFFNDWVHGIDLTLIGKIPQFTFWVYLKGLIEIVLSAYVAGIIFAWFYQKCEEHCKRKGWIK